jgi:diguanylate cyclase (GGDEF)-like protein
MNISILVFGSKDFLTTLPDQIRYSNAFSIEVITNINQAISQIELEPPDIILAQASLNGSIELCYWLKEETKLSCIYCILLEDRPHLLINRDRYSWEWELEMTATALKQGADAYIWQLPTQKTKHTLRQLNTYHQLILAQLTVGLRKVQKYRDLQQRNNLLSTIALADSLTELNNRRALEYDLPRQIKKAKIQGFPLSLIILDVDYFKKVNDSYGHLTGDLILQLLSNRLQKSIRSQDTPFRYGGEEFVVLLANTTNEEALIVAHRLSCRISEEPFTVSKTLAINITISLGIAYLKPEDDDHGMMLLNRADQCLLEAKATGRNKVVSSDYQRHFSQIKAVSS